jgi:DNA-binding GntR family transcriptional regulator
LAEKPSVGQRHVYLNPRRAAEIRRMIDTGEVPSGMKLPSR